MDMLPLALTSGSARGINGWATVMNRVIAGRRRFQQRRDTRRATA